MDPEGGERVVAADPAAVPYAAPPPDLAAESKRAELTAEVERARRWILAVGVMLYTFDMVQAWNDSRLLLVRSVLYRVSFFDGCVLAVFVALWWFAQRRPRTCCVIALVLYWGLQIAAAVIGGDSTILIKGIPVKILFTAALIRAIKSASNAARLSADLAQVFA